MPLNLKSPLEIYRLLDKSNCRRCGEATCLAFASAVSLNRRRLTDCPQLPPELARMEVKAAPDRQPFEPGADYLKQLQEEITRIDLAAAAARTGGTLAQDRLTLKVLGKDFSVDVHGNLKAEIHINPWVAVPFLNYILYGAGLPPVGEWVTLRELPGGWERYSLFQRQAEEPLRQLADRHPELFDDLIRLFSGQRGARHLNSDLSVVLTPLPKVPLMLCYWRPEEEMESSLKIFFDATAAQNLGTESAFILGVGLAHMLKKIMRRHSPETGASTQPSA